MIPSVSTLVTKSCAAGHQHHQWICLCFIQPTKLGYFNTIIHHKAWWIHLPTCTIWFAPLMKHADSLIAGVSMWVCWSYSFTILCTNLCIHYVQTLSFVFQECGLIWCELPHFLEELRLVCLINAFKWSYIF